MEVSNADYSLYNRRKSDTPVENDRRNCAEANIKEKSLMDMAFDAIPTFRRVENIPDKIEKGEDATALGMASLALINLPEDMRDVVGAAKQVKSRITGKKLPQKYDYKKYQHNFSFFRGTAIEKWLHKQVDAGKGWAKWLYKNDKTLAETKFGTTVLKKVNAGQKDIVETEIKDYKGRKADAVMYEGTKFAKLTGRALRRTTKLGILVTAGFELPKLVDAFSSEGTVGQKAEALVKQSAKSAINVASITAGMAYCGAIGSKYGKGFGSLVGMGLGAIAGSKLSEQAQKIID